MSGNAFRSLAGVLAKVKPRSSSKASELVVANIPRHSDFRENILETIKKSVQDFVGPEVRQLEALFAEDVVSYSDGGGIVRTAARAAVSGRERVAKFIASFASHFWTGLTLAWFETNGQASVLMSRDGIPGTFVTIDASAHGMDRIMWIMRPSKLGGISKSGQRLSDRHAAGPAAT